MLDSAGRVQSESANILGPCSTPGPLLNAGSEGEQTQPATRLTAPETTSRNPRQHPSPSRLLNYTPPCVAEQVKEKNSLGKISTSLGPFPLLSYQGIEKYLFSLSYYVLNSVFCTQQVLSDLFLIVTVQGHFFAHFTEGKIVDLTG